MKHLGRAIRKKIAELVAKQVIGRYSDYMVHHLLTEPDPIPDKAVVDDGHISLTKYVMCSSFELDFPVMVTIKLDIVTMPKIEKNNYEEVSTDE